MGAIKAKRIFLSTFLFWVIVNLALAYPACRSYQEKQQLCALGLGEDPGESIARYLKEGPFFECTYDRACRRRAALPLYV